LIQTAATDTQVVHRRALFTTTPDSPPPQLVCPTCDRALVYRQTALNGVNPRERWDYFECPQCGRFEYRHRTRRLRTTLDFPLPLRHSP
jgi:predicted RNA-binding Zn-ribbon protein involved in translation (DUF1610 family)